MYRIWMFLLGAAVLQTVMARQCGQREKDFLLYYDYLDEHKDNNEFDVHCGMLAMQLFNKDWGTNETGECDDLSLELMEKPRCGCPDSNKNEEAKARMMMSRNFIGPQEYNIGNTKWTKKLMTWTVTGYPRKNRHLSNADVDDAMRRGLQIWADQTSIQFQRVSGPKADIRISFETRRHTTKPPFYDFDGQGKVLAHAFFPQSGLVHFDDDENFVLNSDKGTELFIVAAHEFGHTLGISHSNDKNALMAPYYRYANKLELDYDDIYAIQALYGGKTRPVTRPTRPPTRATQRPTQRPTRRPTQRPTIGPVTKNPHRRVCDMIITASFKIGSTTYVFTREFEQTIVYKVDAEHGIDVDSRKHVREMFLPKTGSRFQKRAYPFRVDAATYVPTDRKIFLFSGTRVYRYSVTSLSQEKFYIDSDEKYPKWFDVREFPERPRAAISVKYSNSYQFYMMIFSETMLWFWDFHHERVGAWAYPIKLLGNLMPNRIDSAFSAHDEIVYMVRGDMVYEFNLKRMRVVSRDSIKQVVKEVLKGPCL